MVCTQSFLLPRKLAQRKMDDWKTTFQYFFKCGLLNSCNEYKFNAKLHKDCRKGISANKYVLETKVLEQGTKNPPVT